MVDKEENTILPDLEPSVLRVYSVLILARFGAPCTEGYSVLISDIIPSLTATVRITQIVLGSVGPMLSGI